MSDERWLGWHFLPADRRLQYSDGRRVVKGRILRVDESRPLELCDYGLHASPTVTDALHYAPGPILCRVELIGPRLDGDDKSCAYARRVLAWADASSMLRLWACWCVRQIWPLLTDERSRRAVIVAERFARGTATTEELSAAWAAAWDAARDAASAAASAAAWAAAWDAARAAAWDAAWAAARDAAGAAARAAARDAALGAQSKELEHRARKLLGVRR